MFTCPATDDFFRSRIDQMIDLRHPLAVLSSRMPWQEIEARVAHLLVRKAHAGQAMPDLDLFGEKPQRQAAASKAGRPRVALRIMVSLLYLKHAFNESDEGVVDRWGETPTWQFFSGQAYFEHQRPCDATTLVKFRQLLGEEGVEELLAQTINVALEIKLIKPQELTRVIVDSTVQHKAIAHPTDSRLLETARVKLVEAAKGAGIDLKQTFAKEGKELGRKAARIVAQSGQRKAVDGQPKLYAWHAPEVDCISKGKAKRISEQERKLLRRRQAIEPIIGHLKADHRMGRCHLKGEQGDRLHAVLCAAGYNIKWLLRMIASKGVTFLTTILLCLQQASTQGRSWLAAVMGMRSWAADGRSTLANRLTFGAGRLSQA